MLRPRSHAVLMALIVFISGSAKAYGQTRAVVISQVYVGSVADARLKNDFIELFNPGSENVNLAGWSVQIGKGSVGSWNIVPLSGTLAPGQYFLVKGPANTTGIADIPAGDVNTSIAMDPTAGRLIIANTTEAMNGTCPVGATALQDMYIYGTANGCSNSPTPGPIEANVRNAGGCENIFSTAAPYPRNSAAPRSVCSTPDAAAQAAFTVPAGGGFSRTTAGSSSSLTVGSARLQGASPNGLAIFGFRQGGTLVNEATVPSTTLVQNALIYAEVDSPGNTGIAIANPNNQEVGIRYTYWSASGVATRSGFITIQANGQLARFLNELPFSLPAGTKGAIELLADSPVGVIALRGITNERSEFLVTTFPVVDMSVAPANTPATLAHFAVDGGWRTSVYLVNSSNSTETGTLEFRDAAGQPISIPFFGGSASSIPYSIPARTSNTVQFQGTGLTTKTGSIQVVPAGGTSTPIPVAEFSYRRNNVTVSTAGLTGISSTKFRTYVEASGATGANGSIQSGIAIGNAGVQAITVELSLVRIDGTPAGLSTTLNLAGNGQVAKFLNELFPGVPSTFQGFLRTSTTGSITMVGLRSRFNERGDFLITTVPPVDENSSTAGTVVFPHFADSGGYTTQFVLFGPNGQASSGTMRTLNPAGRNLAITLQ